MSNSKAKKRVLQKANTSAEGNISVTDEKSQGSCLTGEESRHIVLRPTLLLSAKKEVLSGHPQKDNENTSSDENERIGVHAPTVKCERSTPTTNTTTEEQEWHPVRHPKLPNTTSPRYFVNKSGVISSNAKGELRPLEKVKGRTACYVLYIDKGRQSTFKLEEIMAHTFSDVQFDSDKHYIFHKDGDQNNCVWDNLVVCELSTLQELEIARLEKQHPGKKYTVVRNIHNTFTFERYLVSDAGEVYSLISHQHLRSVKHENGYKIVMLCSDTDTKQATSKRLNIRVHSVVIQSFKGRRVNNLHIDHINGEKMDNSLKNLTFVTRSENLSRAYGPIQTAARNVRKEQGNAPKKVTPRPLPPVTEETRWKSVGTLPWNGRSFSQYEVSNMGHVRKTCQPKLLTLGCTPYGYTFVTMYCDKGNSEMTTKAKQFLVRVSRLVANAFVDGYSETQNVVKHLNGDRQDNHAQNLKWISKHCSSIQRTSRKVVATLVDDPAVRKEFPSIQQAQCGLSTFFSKSFAKCNRSFTRMVDWNGQSKRVLIRVF